LQNRSDPAQWPRFAIGLMTARQPMSYAGDGLAEEGTRRLGTVHTARPAADSGRIRQPIRVFQLGQCFLPRTVLRKAPPQCLAARQQTEMRVRKREQRKKGEGRPAIGTAAAMDPNPIVMLVVGLLAAAAMTDDRIVFTNRASAYDDRVAGLCPVGRKLVWSSGN
jgi:hypothetical protein